MINYRKMKVRFKSVLYLGILALNLFIFSDCKRTLKDKDFFGPAYRSAPANFAVISNFSPDHVNTAPYSNGIHFGYPGDSLTFNAVLSDTVTWTITLTGQKSGAVKIINGFSKIIDGSNAKWDGASSNIYFFRNKETVTAVLSFLGTDLKQTFNITVFNAKKYDTKTYNNIRYNLIDDFDNLAQNYQAKNLTGSVYHDLADGNVTMEFDSINKVEEGNSYHMKGTDANNNSYLSGMNTGSLTALYGMVTTTDPDQVYINLFIYGSGKANSALEVKVYEIDTVSKVSNPTYDQKNNDGWISDIIIDWTGWKQVSIKYSSFQRARDPLFGGNGNGIKEPQKFCGMAISLLSQPQTGASVDLNFDYVIVSENGPFSR